MGERIVTVGGARLWTAESGAGLPLMLCNGGAGCCDYLAPVAGMIDDLARVYRWEQRGCGRSDPAGLYGVATCIADLEGLRREFGHERWVIGGHSWGADLALAYARAHPDRAAGLICIAGGRVHNDREWHKEYDRGRTEVGEEMPEFAYPPNMEVNKQLNADWKRYIQDPGLFRDLSWLAVPALFVYGDRDIRPFWPVEQVARLMPHARFDLIEGAAHNLWLQRPEELKALLRNFIERLGQLMEEREDELCPEYDRTLLRGGVRGKYNPLYQAGRNLVRLDPDVSAAFPDEKR